MGTNLAPETNKFAVITLSVLLVLLTIRIAGVLVTPLNLGPDEAQYWRWGQSFDWGYYSKPPMIAWMIGGLTAIFGESEWAARIASPVLHVIVAGILFVLGKKMFNDRVGMFAALGYALMPGVILGSGLVSTDSVLMPFFAAGLLALWRLRGGAGWKTAIVLGGAIGFGFLSKYAMIYFVIGLALTIAIDAPTRKAMLTPNGLVALLVAGLIFAPHMIWNANNGFQTVSHTADNANWGAELLNFENAIEFLVNQIAIFGPVGFLTLLIGMFLLRGQAGASEYQKERWLLCFILPVLTVIFVQSIISRAHANWAATAYPAASILVTAWLVRAGPNKAMWIAIAVITFAISFAIPGIALPVQLVIGIGMAAIILLGAKLASYEPDGLLWAALAIHAVIMSVFTAAAIGPVSVSENLGLASAFKRTRGWEETTAILADKARAIGATSVLVDERENWHGLDYYGRDSFPVPVYNWRSQAGVKSFADIAQPNDETGDVVLVASIRPRFRPRIRADFETVEELGYISIPLGGGKERKFKLYRAEEFRPLERTEEWDKRFDGVTED